MPVSWQMGVWVCSASFMLSSIAFRLVFPASVVSVSYACCNACLMSSGR